MPERWLVSACLLGEACRYDGRSKGHRRVAEVVAEAERRGVEIVAVCPESQGGLPTPRPAADLRNGDGHAVLDGRATVATVGDDRDVTAAFLAGATAAAQPCARALLKARSPSCGVGTTHIDGRVGAGDGVFAATLRRAGVVLQTEDDLDD